MSSLSSCEIRQAKGVPPQRKSQARLLYFFLYYNLRPCNFSHL